MRNAQLAVVPAEDPAAFLPLVRRCAGAAPMAVRRLAAQALSPLVTTDGVPALVQELAQSLPQEGDPVRHNEVRMALCMPAVMLRKSGHTSPRHQRSGAA